MLSHILSRLSVILNLCILTALAQNEGFTENPTSVSVDRGEQVTLSCTYRTTQQQLPIIITWSAPSGILVMPASATIDANTVRSTITFTAASSSYAGNYQCMVTVGSNQINSDLATLTVNYYLVQFQERLYTTFESFNTFFVDVAATQFGSPSRNATISFTRDDNGPAINDSIVSMTGRINVEGLIPNDEIRMGERYVINLMLTTNDNLIEIGSLSRTAVEVTEDDLDPPASVTPSVHRVTTGSDATFMATEYSAELFPQYTWSFNGEFIFNNPKVSGQSTRNLTISNAQESDEGNYTCFMSIGGANGQGTGQLFVFAPVSITSHPVNVTVNGTEEAIFSVEATGGGLTYQWKKNGRSLIMTAGKLEGVNTPTLTVLDAQVGDEGFYSCEVTNGAGDSATSDEAFLHTVGLIERPMNMIVDRGELVTFTCTYRTTEPQTSIIINYFDGPSTDTTQSNLMLDRFTLQSNLSFNATSSSFVRSYQCTVTVGGDHITSEAATLTISYYTVQFETRSYEVSEANNTFILSIDVTAVGSPLQNAVVSFTRDDGGPAINDLTINTTGRLEVEVQIPNDMVRTGDRTVSVELSTSDILVTIGQQNTAFVLVFEDDPITVATGSGPGNSALGKKASNAVLVFFVITSLYHYISSYVV